MPFELRDSQRITTSLPASHGEKLNPRAPATSHVSFFRELYDKVVKLSNFFGAQVEPSLKKELHAKVDSI